MRRYLAAALLFAAAGCGDSSTSTQPLPSGAAADPKAAPPAGADSPAAPAAAAAPAGAAATASSRTAVAVDPNVDPGKQALLEEVRSRKFKNDDFVESETNRDPFRSFLSDFASGPTINTPQYEILMPKYSLDELKLAMIVGPPTEQVGSRVISARDASGRHVEPRAMFIDPTGMGVSVVRGKHISKADAKVIRIEPDKGKIFVEIKEDLGGGKFRSVERVLELHQGEPVTEGNQ